MNFDKLRLNKFKTYDGYNLPDNFHPPLEHQTDAEVLFAFCASFEDVARFANLARNRQTHKNNRLFFVYKKGNKDFHRDHIYAFCDAAPFLRRKAPILSSLSDAYSCFAFEIIV